VEDQDTQGKYVGAYTLGLNISRRVSIDKMQKTAASSAL
jgi:hypothetical protein